MQANLKWGRYEPDEGRTGRIGGAPLGHSWGLCQTGETFCPFGGIWETDGTTMPSADIDDGVGRSRWAMQHPLKVAWRVASDGRRWVGSRGRKGCEHWHRKGRSVAGYEASARDDVEERGNRAGETRKVATEVRKLTLLCTKTNFPGRGMVHGGAGIFLLVFYSRPRSWPTRESRMEGKPRGWRRQCRREGTPPMET
jgi:hypothetical protein